MIEQSIIHFHIPKTAGSTIDSILAPCFRPEERFSCGSNFTGFNHFESNVYFSGLPDNEKMKYKYISGHVEYFLLQSYPAQHFSFTILRNPLDRMISMYYYILRTKTHHLYDVLHEDNVSLAGFMEGGFWHEIDNGMCRRLSGVCAQAPYGECSREVCELAKFNLANNLSFVGLQERFDESLFLLLYHLSALDRLDYTRANVNPFRKKPQEISSADRAVVLQRNAWDVELYAFARELYCQRNASLAARLQRPMQKFRHAMALKDVGATASAQSGS